MAEATLATEFAGKRRALFWLAFKTGVLTVLTLGIYRFWMKSRLRRWYWSSVRPGGHPLEYTGEPLEKLLGFLIAVVFLAFYLGLVNLGLMFVSLSLFSGVNSGYAIWFLGLLPLLFFARYRARRYILARTRWRGLRFGLEPGAWAYSLRALWHWGLTILTLGLYWPVMAFRLEEFRTNRTWYGNARLHQHGRPGMLYPASVHLLIGIFVSAAAIIGGKTESDEIFKLLAASVPWTLFGFIYWRVESMRILTSAKTVGGNAVALTPRVSRVGRIYVMGSLWMLLALILIGLINVVIIFAVFAVVAGSLSLFDNPYFWADIPLGVTAAYGVLAYATFMLTWGVLVQVFFTLPLMRHFAENLTLSPAEGYDRIVQRADDAVEGADGFAEALDVGAAI